MELDKIEIGKRFKEFGLSKFESIKSFANAIDMHASSLSSKYFTGKSLPGSELLAKLAELGCDIHWLLFGITENEADNQLLLEKVAELKAEIVVLNEDLEYYKSTMETLTKNKDKSLKETLMKLSKAEKQIELLQIRYEKVKQENVELMKEIKEKNKS